ncbi:MAG: glycosyltransferase family 4 protein [bacterium]|nr:glycosyltransferase family 4 protein [bacterium]
MRIALIHRLFRKEGAIPLTVKMAAKHLSEKGIENIVFSADVENGAQEGLTTFVRVFTKRIKLFDLGGWLFAGALFFKLISAHREKPIDVLQVHDSTAFYGAWLFSRIYRVPVIIFMHTCIFEPGKKGMYPWTLDFMYRLNTGFYVRHADRIACITKDLTEWAKKLGANPEAIKLIHEPVDFQLFKPQEGKLEGGKRLLFVGRVSSPEKGSKYLFEAMAKIVKVFPEVKLTIIGEGCESPDLSRLIEKLGLKETIEFNGLLPNNELAPYYAGADVMVIPSLAEGLPKVLIEALSCGTPVIGTRVGGIPEVIRDGCNGLLVDPGSSEQIAEAVTRLFSNEDLLKCLSENARSSVETRSWESNIDKYIEMYKEL